MSLTENAKAMSFLKRFEATQRARGREVIPLFENLPVSEPAPEVEALVKPDSGLPVCRTVDDIQAEIKARRQSVSQTTPPSVIDRYAAAMPPPIRVQREYRFNLSDTLTSCLDTAECPQLARRLFRLLHELALTSIRARGLPAAGVTVGVFHLPLELLAAHFQVDRTTIWRNLKPLQTAGVIDARDHFGKLRGQTAVTGKVWAVSIHPERQLSGHADAVKVRHEDLKYSWRNLDADAESGRTVWNLTRTEEQKEAYRAKQSAQQEERAEARQLAAQRALERQEARKRGEKVLTGRKAATVNAAETRVKKPRREQGQKELQQSIQGLKAVEKQELIRWVLDGFSKSTDVTLTVAAAISGGLEVIFTLPALAGLSRQRRNAEVERAARALANSFEDNQNIRFWCWLIWQLIRGADQGQNYSDDVAHLLARVLHDIKHDESMYSRAQKKPAALVIAELKACGIYDALKQLAPTRAGGRPKAA